MLRNFGFVASKSHGLKEDILFAKIKELQRIFIAARNNGNTRLSDWHLVALKQYPGSYTTGKNRNAHDRFVLIDVRETSLIRDHAQVVLFIQGEAMKMGLHLEYREIFDAPEILDPTPLLNAP